MCLHGVQWKDTPVTRVGWEGHDVSGVEGTRARARSSGTHWFLEMPFVGSMWLMPLIQIYAPRCKLVRGHVSVVSSCGSGGEVGVGGI